MIDLINRQLNAISHDFLWIYYAVSTKLKPGNVQPVFLIECRLRDAKKMKTSIQFFFPDYKLLKN